jgi:hypothetical protein
LAAQRREDAGLGWEVEAARRTVRLYRSHHIHAVDEDARGGKVPLAFQDEVVPAIGCEACAQEPTGACNMRTARRVTKLHGHFMPSRCGAAAGVYLMVVLWVQASAHSEAVTAAELRARRGHSLAEKLR